MGTPHKHRDVIVAWANGEKTEYLNPNTREWEILDPEATPAFHEDYEYRIKPKRVKKEGWVNVSPVRTGSICAGALYTTQAYAEHFASDDRITCIRIEWEEEAQ